AGTGRLDARGQQPRTFVCVIQQLLDACPERALHARLDGMYGQRAVVPTKGLRVRHRVPEAPQPHGRAADLRYEVGYHLGCRGPAVLVTQDQAQPIPIASACLVSLGGDRRLLSAGVQRVRSQRVAPVASVVGTAVARPIVTDQAYV